jgi:mucin-19
MAISKITTGSIADGAVVAADLADSSVTSAKIAANPEFSGTEAAKMPSGTTGQRANAAAGDIRFNTTLSLMEYYDGSLWKAIDSPPTITNISPTTFTTSGTEITVTGSNFQSGVNVKLLNTDGTELTPDTVTRVSSSELTFETTAGMISDGKDSFDIRVINASGLSVTYDNALDINSSFSFTTSSGSLGTIYDSARGSYSISSAAGTISTSESDASVAYSVLSGSLPTGLSLNSSTGAITGTANAVGSDATSNFTIRAALTDTSTGVTTNNDRAFSIVTKAPVITSFTSTGSSTWTVPTGLSAVTVLAVAGGGGGGGSTSGGNGGGGGGGVVYHTSFPVTPAGSVSYTVGAGGNYSGPGTVGTNGGDSTFGSLTAKGGGKGGGSSAVGNENGYPGGSGGGSTEGPTGGYSGGSATQPGTSNPGATNYGYPGGNNSLGQGYSGGGGGGAGGVGGNGGGPSYVGAGGPGVSNSITGSPVYYAGGGGASMYTGGATPNGGPGGQGGGGQGGKGGVQGGGVGGTNTGGGGGASYNTNGANGGPGIIIVKY